MSKENATSDAMERAQTEGWSEISEVRTSENPTGAYKWPVRRHPGGPEPTVYRLVITTLPEKLVMSITALPSPKTPRSVRRTGRRSPLL